MRARLTLYCRLLRLDTPVGIWLLFFPAGVASVMAQPSAPDAGLVLLLLLGAAITRSGGCVINDLTDRKLDAQVARTRLRPLASGAIAVPHALMLLAALGASGLALLLFLPKAVAALAFLAVPMIALYPWMKRITWWPQLFLGLTFNIGVPMGWAATGADFTAATGLLYAGCVFWTLGYDTIYALQDAHDDRAAGIKSTALRLGTYVVPFVTACYVAFLLCLAVAGLASGAGFLYVFGLAVVALHLGLQVRHLGPGRAQHAPGKLFRSNQWLGLVWFVALALDRIVASGAALAN